MQSERGGGRWESATGEVCERGEVGEGEHTATSPPSCAKHVADTCHRMISQRFSALFVF